ncbi:membrane-associated protein [Mariprofundus sp. KV]|uniref:membrane-associated protein n=1 Tax=Mariprofundus sp. KV TaxID=2608715 RepID=UPI0015A13672|nr:membrane-associated protein [Mariprofundus sp. KV]NWF36565.1 membrane-associated protein [Mariprofundus sp. KV]
MNELLPLWLKLCYSAYVAITLIVYWFKYGPGNYLWFSDIALILTLPALWLESPLLASMMLLAVLLPEIVWSIGFFSGLLTGKPVGGLADYMFDRNLPLYLRALSLFHLFLPPLLIWMVFRLGYDENALLWQTLLAWIVLPLSYLISDPIENVNWVHGPGGKAQHRLPPLLYLAVLMLGFPLLIYLPTHWLFLFLD